MTLETSAIRPVSSSWPGSNQPTIGVFGGAFKARPFSDKDARECRLHGDAERAVAGRRLAARGPRRSPVDPGLAAAHEIAASEARRRRAAVERAVGGQPAA